MPGVTIVIDPPGSATKPERDERVPHDLVAFFLNADLLKVFELIGSKVFTVANGQPTLSPNARLGAAALLGADLTKPDQAQAVDDQLARALAAYMRYLDLSGQQLDFADQIRVLLRDLDAPNQPIP